MLFALSKIQRPLRRADLSIERPTLERRLGAALLTQRLVLLSAAAGFGKTSALARQLDLLPAGTGVAWVSCDEGDTLAGLFECLVAALEPLDLPWRVEPDVLVQKAATAAPTEIRALAADLINALDASAVAHGVIVLDDLHRVDDAALFALLDELALRLPPRWTLVLSTRHDPPMALARLRVQAEMAEFRLDDLRFDTAEVARVLAGAGLQDAGTADRLFERTQGWPVAVRLALGARRMAGGPLTPEGLSTSTKAGVIDRHVFDFLADEVTDRLEPALRDFLLATCVLPELTASRCAALSGDATAAARLEQIERAELFVTRLDADKPTLRLHDLFREALELRLQREAPERWQQALRLAAQTEPDPARRVTWLQRAGDWDAAELALMEVSEVLDATGALSQLRVLLDKFPAARRAQSPRLQMMQARSQWDWDATLPHLERAAANFHTQGATAEEVKALSYVCRGLSGANRHAQLRETAAALLARPDTTGDALARTLSSLAWVELSRGDQRQLPTMLERMLATLQALPQTPAALPRWAECAPLTPYVGIAGLRTMVHRFINEAARRWPEQPTPLRGQCHLLQAWLHVFAGDVDAAEVSLAACLDDARWLGAPPNLDAPSRSLQGLVLALRGRRDEALHVLAGVVEQISHSRLPLRVAVYRDLYVYMALRSAALLGDEPALRNWAEALDTEADERSWLSPALRGVARAHLAALDGDLDTACSHWQALLADETHGDLYGQRVDTRLRLADALLRNGDSAQAAAALRLLFARLNAEGDAGAVLLAGPTLLQRLADAHWGLTLPEASQAQLRAWARQSTALATGDEAPAPGAAAPPPRDTPPGGLTARELEVLTMIAQGDSNKLIARTLDLSPHTVKRHVANILDKLGLASRGQATAWHHEHVGR